MPEKFKVLAHEDQAEYDRLLSRYRSVLDPKSLVEDFLVEMMVEARWRLARTRRFEAALATSADVNAEQLTADARIASKLNQAGKGSKLLQRYLKSAEQTYRRAHRELTRIRQETQPLGPAELLASAELPPKLEFGDLGDFALRS